jgi:hypothetical protein
MCCHGRCRYDGSRQVAVLARADGTASISYPNGMMAIEVSVDDSAEATAAAAAAGTAAPVSEQPDGPSQSSLSRPPLKLFAMYRSSGNVAASWSSACGGYLQHSDGSLMLHRNQAGSTRQYAKGGKQLASWPAGESADVAPLDLDLDDQLSARVDVATGALELRYSCQGVAYVLCSSGCHRAA